MAIRNIDAVVFGVEDMAAAQKFLEDFGLAKVDSETGSLAYETLSGAQVIARPINDPALPPPMEPGPTLREVIWGSANEAGLQGAEAQIMSSGASSRGTDGVLRVTDTNGLSHGVRLSRLKAIQGRPVLSNSPGNENRIDTRSPVYERATPASIGHVVFFVDDLDAMKSFFIRRLGFVISDTYPGHAAFLRTQLRGVHHNTFLLSRKGKPGLNHVAFTVNDVHEVFGGGLAMSRRGWRTEIGPGRHPISSAYFWYFQSPFGGALEYYADEDVCTEAWVPREFERCSENFAEWAVEGGIDGHSRRQIAGPSSQHDHSRGG